MNAVLRKVHCACEATGSKVNRPMSRMLLKPFTVLIDILFVFIVFTF